MAEARSAPLGPSVLRLDDLDRKLLLALRANGRATYADLAAQVGLSHAATRVRVQHLLKASLVRIAAIPDPAVMGVGSTGMVEVEAGAAAKDVGERISSLPETSFVAVAAGRIDLIAEVRCTTDEHLLQCFDRIRDLGGVRRLETYKYLAIVEDAYTPAQPADPIDLDDVDRSLVVELQRDGRASYTDLAEAIGLSHAAARVRVQRILKARAVTVVGLIDPMALQMGEMGGFGLSVDESALDVATRIAKMPSVIFVAASSGRHDVLGTIVGSSDRDILQTLDTIRSQPGVRSLESYAILAIIKEQYATSSERPHRIHLGHESSRIESDVRTVPRRHSRKRPST